VCGASVRAALMTPDETLTATGVLARPAVSVHEIDPLNDLRWTALVKSHPGASVFHSTNWLKALHTAYGYKPVAITTSAPGERLTDGLVFCQVESWLTGRRFVSLPFSDHWEPLIDRAGCLDGLLQYMKPYVDGGRWKYVEMRPVSNEPSYDIGFGRMVTYCWHRLDLRRSEQELFRGFHKDCVQRKIRRAERENLKYEEGASEELLQTFYRLLVMTRRRHYLPPQPLSWFRGLITAFGDRLKIRVASKEGLPVASMLTLSHKKSMVYKYGCSDATFNRLGGVAFLFWRAIQDAKEKGLQELDMGRSGANNAGLIAFKDHWGATRSPLTYWTYPCRPTRAASPWKKRLAKQIVSASPDWGLETVGRLLYRHIG